MHRTKQLEKRVERLERGLKKMMDVLELSPVTDPFKWETLSNLDKNILTFLLQKKYLGATTTEIAKALEMDQPEIAGRVIVWKRLKRIQQISLRLKGAPIVITEKKRWRMNYDEFTFNE